MLDDFIIMALSLALVLITIAWCAALDDTSTGEPQCPPETQPEHSN